MNKIPVLIVGAGPSGLMLACQLARFGTSFRIVDPKAGPTRESRALAVQSRTMEIYDQLSLASAAYAGGNLLGGARIYTAGRERATVDLAGFGKTVSPFAGLLILEQSKNEELLLAKLRELGHDVEWGVGFKSMEMLEDHCIVTLGPMGDGADETLRADWVVGCDGARSPVRHSIGMPFVGGTYAATFYIADVEIEGNLLQRDFASIFFQPNGLGLSFPMTIDDNGKEQQHAEEPQQRFRLVGVVPSQAYETPGWLENPTFDVVGQAFRDLTAMPLSFSTPSWFATYSVHHRKAEHFRQNHVLLVGDAAHVHSPAGGQGMNTGLSDAHNLGWKLAYASRGLVNESILNTYADEREPFAKMLLRTTDGVFRFLAGSGRLAGFLRMHVVPHVARVLLKLSAVREAAFGVLSQTGVSYRDGPLTRGGNGGQGKIKAGDRFPAFDLVVGIDGGEPVLSLELLKSPGFCIVDFTKDGIARPEVDSMTEKIRVPIRYFACKVGAKTMAAAGLADQLYVVRPDMYVGMVASRASEDEVVNYFRTVVRAKISSYHVL